MVKLKDLKVGDVLIPDDGFSCMAPGSEHTVQGNDAGLYIHCEAGLHYLSGQLGPGEELIGLTKKEPQ